MKLKPGITTLFIVLFLLLTGCSSSNSEAEMPADNSSQPAEITPTEVMIEKGVTIYYHDAFQFELIDSEGARVLIDIEFPDKLTSPATENDILLTTTTNYHTYVNEFIDSFPGEQIFAEEGQIKTDRVSVIGMSSAYIASEMELDYKTNFIYLIEMDELRIAVLGQMGQEAFTSDQLAFLGEVDIVLTQFVNTFSEINTTNQFGFKLMDELKPKLIIPTFGNSSMDVMNLAAERWDMYVDKTESVTISSSMLSNDTQFLVLGGSAEAMQTIFEFPDWAE